MLIVLSPLIVCLIGLVIYIIAGNPKVSEVGRIMLWTGLLAFLLGGVSHAAKLFS